MNLVQEHTNQFLNEVINLFPHIRADLIEDTGLLHLQFGSIWPLANTAIASKDWATYVALSNLVDHYYQPENDELLPFTNAVNVSFLEMLDLEDGDNGENAEAWAPTPPKLQQGFGDIVQHLYNLNEAIRSLDNPENR